jgi:hypothetical protein
VTGFDDVWQFMVVSCCCHRLCCPGHPWQQWARRHCSSSSSCWPTSLCQPRAAPGLQGAPGEAQAQLQADHHTQHCSSRWQGAWAGYPVCTQQWQWQLFRPQYSGPAELAA